MNEARVVRAAYKAWQLGPRKTITVLAARLYTKWYERRQRARAMAGNAHYTWAQICKVHHYRRPFADFFTELRMLSFDQVNFLPYLLTTDQLKADARHAADKCIDLLGSGARCFMNFPWHDDFKAAEFGCDSYSFGLDYYKDIQITVGDSWQLSKDIKVPWELSRFQHLFPLSVEYRSMNNQEYAAAFEQQITDWLNHNPFLRGPNWVCPMDVALRAINWIWGFEAFKNEPLITTDFWERFVCSLYDHLVYLENNWEIYDTRTSNHYFSDLVGYLYLTLFFRPFSQEMSNKAVWCWQEIIREITKQFGNDGTNYEGSTGYHRLMTELVYHALYVAQQLGLPIDSSLKALFEKMCLFLSWCMINKDEIIMIGDYDSGKVLFYGLPLHLYSHNQAVGKKVYPHFGISFLKTNTVHVSLRHHVYRPQQPSGHFHNDVGSMTLGVNGIPLIVDPGSYCYTPSAEWRNYFRSTYAHNTVVINDQEQVPFDNTHLFGLNLPSAVMDEVSDDDNTLMMKHELFKGTMVYRRLTLHKESIELVDAWETINGEKVASKNITWTFIVHPDVQVEIRDLVVRMYHKKTLVLILESDLAFNLHKTFYAPAYGVKQETVKLVAQRNLLPHGEHTIRFLFNC